MTLSAMPSLVSVALCTQLKWSHFSGSSMHALHKKFIFCQTSKLLICMIVNVIGWFVMWLTAQVKPKKVFLWAAEVKWLLHLINVALVVQKRSWLLFWKVFQIPLSLTSWCVKYTFVYIFKVRCNSFLSFAGIG